jgi:hypothetical protein
MISDEERAFANRTEGDYKDRRTFETDQVESLFSDGKKIITIITEMLG